MTIRKGGAWGADVARPPDLAVAGSDAELARLVEEGGRALSVERGDVHRALGAPGRRDTMVRLPMDLLRVEIDGERRSAVAHVVARRSWWRGPIVVVANVDHLGAWNVAPRAHPNDGRFDVVEVAPTMSLRARLQARSRLVQGTHVPHPSIATATATDRTWEFDRPTRVWVDGVPAGHAATLRVTIEPDAFAVHV